MCQTTTLRGVFLCDVSSFRQPRARAIDVANKEEKCPHLIMCQNYNLHQCRDCYVSLCGLVEGLAKSCADANEDDAILSDKVYTQAK